MAGELTFDPPQVGRPDASPTVRLYKADGTALAAEASATRDPVDTTLDGIVAADAQSVTLTSVANVVIGRDYLMTNEDGQREWVRPTSVDTSTREVGLLELLRYGYEDGASFQGCRLSYSVSSSLLDTLGIGYEARWGYTIGSESDLQAITHFDVVLNAWPASIVDTREWRRYGGSLASRILLQRAGEILEFDDELRQASEDLYRDILTDGRQPSRFRSFEAFKTVVFERLKLTWAEDGRNIPSGWQGDPQGYLDERRRIYANRLSQALETTQDYDADQSGGVSATEQSAPLSTRRIRL